MIGITVVTIAASAPPVRTTGINWASIVTVVCSVVGALALMLGIFSKLIANQITSAINRFRVDVINQLDTRLTRVEGKIDDIPTRQRR